VNHPAQADEAKGMTPRPEGWQPIETAPIEEFRPAEWFTPHSPSLLLWTNYPVVGNYGYTKYGKGRWRSWQGTVNPTHWMPLPAPPALHPDGGNPR
jgi:hypothetical protein